MCLDVGSTVYRGVVDSGINATVRQEVINGRHLVSRRAREPWCNDGSSQITCCLGASHNGWVTIEIPTNETSVL